MINIIWWEDKFKSKFKNREVRKIKSFLEKIKNGKVFNADPGQIKDIVKDTGEKDSLLILGGHDLFPFCEVKNPTNDWDTMVWTDNPYGSLDSDFLLPERPVGRLPDGGRVKFLLNQLQYTLENGNEFEVFIDTYGLSASVWQDASRNIYRILSENDILLSPPEDSSTVKIKNETTFNYFNLHGSDTKAEWYGQEGSDYPVALTTKNIPNLKNSIVFSEACYGGYILKKKIKDSIALSFLKRGVIGFVGSTTIAYGPPKPPPTEADLMANLFLEEVIKGRKFGRALLNAKYEFFKIMIAEQGFLDGDDRKTLLQFVLYGNPESRVLVKNKKGLLNG